MKLEDLPEPLTKREFKEICIREGLLNHVPVEAQLGTANNSRQEEVFSMFRDMQLKRQKEKWNYTLNNLFGTYLAIYDLFKTWHSGIIQTRHVGPEAVGEHVASQRARSTHLQGSK